MDVPSVGSAGLRFDRRLRLLVAAAVATALLASGVPGPVSATIYSPPWADAMWAHFPGSGGLDTTTSMKYVRDGFASEYEAFSTNPVSAHVALGTSYAQSDAIWWMAGHAGAGVIQTYNATTGWSSIYTSKSIGGTCAAPNDCLSNYTSTVMHRIRLMVFMGCKSGVLTGGDGVQALVWEVTLSGPTDGPGTKAGPVIAQAVVDVDSQSGVATVVARG